MIALTVLARVFLRYAGITAVGSMLLLASCATTPPEPTVALKSAEQAIAAADRARIADATSPELNEAREKLAAARNAARAKDMAGAERLALEARVDAELASARNDAAKAQAFNEEIKQGTATLVQEMQRKTGDRQ
jgi:hypothetical protein